MPMRHYQPSETFLADLHARFQPREFSLVRPVSDFPELLITVPDEWPYVQLAPFYDVHIGHRRHDSEMFRRHVQWLVETPYVLGFNGGDLFDNSSTLGVFDQSGMPQEQIRESAETVAEFQHKLLFSLPGNHEDRTAKTTGIDVAELLSWMMKVPYFPDFAIVTIQWRGNNFRILAHHGSGAATTAGAQRMAARKSIGWAKPIDLYWIGHLHNPLVDLLFQTDFDQQTHLAFERDAFVIISPSYLQYFGTYAAKQQLQPGTRGMAVITLQEDGRMDASLHARGRRL